MKVSQNKVTFGLTNVYVAFLETESPPTWDTPVRIPGAVRFTPTTVGEQTDFYADNTLYFTYTANNGYTAELEMANVPDAILAEMLRWQIDENGAIIEISEALPKPFALMGQVQGDQRNRRFVFYHCTASRPAKERTTTEASITPATDVLNLIISPIEIDGRMVVKGELELSDTNEAVYNNFFNAVYTPLFSGGDDDDSV